MVQEALDARPYALTALFATLSVIFLLRWLDGGSTRWFWWFTVGRARGAGHAAVCRSGAPRCSRGRDSPSAHDPARSVAQRGSSRGRSARGVGWLRGRHDRPASAGGVDSRSHRLAICSMQSMGLRRAVHLSVGSPTRIVVIVLLSSALVVLLVTRGAAHAPRSLAPTSIDLPFSSAGRPYPRLP